MDREHCALLSRELGEQLGGTGPVVGGWVALEHPGPWSPKAPTDVELGPLAAHLDVAGVRVQLIRPVHHQHVPLPQPTGHTVLLAHAGVDPSERWVERVVVDDLAGLADLDPTTVLRPTRPGLGEVVDHDVWLVCVHARRDACCAVHGRPVAAALDAAGIEVWETTHTGGHRFAATAVVLPDGLSLGRLDTVDAVGTATDLAHGVLPPGLLRGRCAVPRPVQAAEAALRTELGATARHGVLPVGHHAGDGGTTVALLDVAGARWTATVTTSPASPARPVSDGAAPTEPDHHDVTDLRRDVVVGPPVGSTVVVDESKYPGTQHWRFAGTVLGTDERGTWLGMPRGTVAQRGDEPPRRLATSFVVLVPHEDPWVVEHYADHDEVVTYVNIGTRPRWEGDRVTQVDLDLDVVRTHDGDVRVLDRDEFATHRRTLGYPQRLVDLAETAATRAVAVLESGEDPFGAARWLARLTDGA